MKNYVLSKDICLIANIFFNNIDFLFKINSYAEPEFFRTPTRHNFLLALFN